MLARLCVGMAMWFYVRVRMYTCVYVRVGVFIVPKYAHVPFEICQRVVYTVCWECTRISWSIHVLNSIKTNNCSSRGFLWSPSAPGNPVSDIQGWCNRCRNAGQNGSSVTICKLCSSIHIYIYIYIYIYIICLCMCECVC